MPEIPSAYSIANKYAFRPVKKVWKTAMPQKCSVKGDIVNTTSTAVGCGFQFPFGCFAGRALAPVANWVVDTVTGVVKAVPILGKKQKV